ncbi:MAG: carbon monoxide dehydrogenase [Chitinophagaceae bacterium]|nr:MAG: carbon monoxide dehydrogenase [Chitinophagaceae bacterium]
MQLTGKHTVTATPVTLWAMLMDTGTLAKIVPGISRLEKTGENTFKSFIDIKMGLISGSFTGDLQMEDVQVQKGFTLKVHQSSSVGKANAAIKIELIPINETQTEISFDGDVKLTGLLASMGQRVLGGVANTLTKQFFANLEKEAPSRPSPTGKATDAQGQLI